MNTVSDGHVKTQITRLLPHQNGKVFGVLMAIVSLVFFLPFFLYFVLAGPPDARPSLFMMLVMPLVYLVLGYVMVALGCVLYNFMFRYIGGIEFESTADGP